MGKKRKNNKQNIGEIIASIIILMCVIVCGYISQDMEDTNNTNEYNTETFPLYLNISFL